MWHSTVVPPPASGSGAFDDTSVPALAAWVLGCRPLWRCPFPGCYWRVGSPSSVRRQSDIAKNCFLEAVFPGECRRSDYPSWVSLLGSFNPEHRVRGPSRAGARGPRVGARASRLSVRALHDFSCCGATRGRHPSHVPRPVRASGVWTARGARQQRRHGPPCTRPFCAGAAWRWVARLRRFWRKTPSARCALLVACAAACRSS